MKNTKEITTGAMLLAIFGVVLLIDRYLSYLFSAIVPLAVSVVIIIYGNKYGLKNGSFFSIAALIISFVLAPEPRYVYFVLMGAISGNLFNYLLKKQFNSFTLILSIIIVFTIAELFDIFVLSYVFYKQSFYQIVVSYLNEASELIKSIKNIISSNPSNTSALYIADALNVISSYFLNEQTISTLLIFSCVFVGIMEGAIIYILSAVLLKRFKINAKIGFNQILTLNPIVAYVLFFISCSVLVNRFYYHSIITPIIIGLSSISIFILAYYGYIYLLVIFRVKYNMKHPILLVLIIILTFPTSALVLFIIGFLYGTGFLKKHLIIERKENE